MKRREGRKLGGEDAQPSAAAAWTEGGCDQRCDQQAARRSTWLPYLRMGFLA